MAAKPIYAVGDIHGQFDLLQDIMARIEHDGGPDAQVVFVGDYTDRGPKSDQVLEYLSSGLKAGRNWVCLKGNHDRMFFMFMEEYPRNDARFLVGYHWLHPRIGGVETLGSYGVEVADGARIYQVHEHAREAVPQSHVDFLNALKPYHQQRDLLFVHAGIQPGVPLSEQTEDDLIWIREPFLSDKTRHPFTVVHGHSHVSSIEHHGNRINIDTGAGHGRALSCVVIDGDVFELLPTGRRRVPQIGMSS